MNGSPDTIRGTSWVPPVAKDHLNPCVCDFISGLFNLTDTRGRVVSMTSKWSWYTWLMITTRPSGCIDGRAMATPPIWNWRSWYIGTSVPATTSALNVTLGLPASTRRCWSAVATVIGWPAPATMKIVVWFFKHRQQKHMYWHQFKTFGTSLHW